MFYVTYKLDWCKLDICIRVLSMCFWTECLVCAVTCWRSSQMAWGVCGRSTLIRLPPASWPPVWVFSCANPLKIYCTVFNPSSACLQTLTLSLHLSPLRWWQWKQVICSWALVWATHCCSGTLRNFRKHQWKRAKRTRRKRNRCVWTLVKKTFKEFTSVQNKFGHLIAC